LRPAGFETGQEVGVDVGVAAEVASVGLADVIPAGVLGDQRFAEQIAGGHGLDAAEVMVGRAGVDAIELDPGAGAGDLGVDFGIPFVLGVDPDEVIGGAFGFREDFELFEGGDAVAGVGGEGEAGFAAGEGGGADEVATDGRERAPVDTDLDEAGLRAFDAVVEFGEEAAGELVGGFGLGVGGQEEELAGGVEAGVGPDVDAGGVGESAKEDGVATEEVGGAIEKASAAEGGDLLQLGEGEAVDFVGVVPRAGDLGGADEVDKDVLMDEGGGRGGRQKSGEEISAAHAPYDMGMRNLLFLLPMLVMGQSDWRHYRGGVEQTSASTLRQITKANVAKLLPAWTYDSGDAQAGTEIQCNPLVVDGVLYGTSAMMQVFALDAATGKELWKFDPSGGKPVKERNRGLVLWESGRERRLFVTWRNWLIALDPKTGQLIKSFGKDGRVDLREGLGRDPETVSISSRTPGVLYQDLLIQGSLVPEGLPSAPGDIRAYDVRTGKIAWTFHTLPRPGEPGYETWPKEAWKYAGGTNSWAGLALDEKRGTVFAPTGSASFDFYGANRHGDNLYANCLLALDAATGKLKWHFQFVRHDVWDRDLPAPPTLVTVKREGKTIDAVAQLTKSGHVFVFDRDTGKSLFPLTMVDVPDSAVPGEKLARQQVLPQWPKPFARQELTEDMIPNAVAKARFRQVKSGPQFTPPSVEGTIVFPGFDGGAEWGGAAFDATSGLLFVNANEMPWILRMVPRKTAASGQGLYIRNCASCHREDRAGSPPQFPSLAGAKADKRAEWERIVEKGLGRMPAFGHLPAGQRAAILDYLLAGKNEAVAETKGGPEVMDYQTDGYNKFLDPDGYPAVKPPWGTLNAIDLNTGEYRWQQPFGEFPQLADKTTGSENYGGPLVTAGGVLFIGATNHDRQFRAFDKDTGKLLWQTTLSAGGNATPATYMVNGRQYVVIAAGGGKSGAPSGASYHAFVLPQATPSPGREGTK
jgi:quinoprotein glucose dehydrogenase